MRTRSNPVLIAILWLSMGSMSASAQTASRVKDINQGGSSLPENLTDVGGTLFFSASDDAGPGIWKSDGTAAGTVLVQSLGAATPGSAVYDFSAFDQRLFFGRTACTGGYCTKSVQRTDGTSGSTLSLYETASNPTWGCSPSKVLPRPGLAFFTSRCTSNGIVTGIQLLKTDGVNQATSLGSLSSSNPESVQTALWFGSPNLYVDQTVNTTSELFVSDGASAPTRLVELSEHSWTGALESFDGATYYTYERYDSSLGRITSQLRKTDGTAAGTVMVKDFGPGSLEALVSAGATLFLMVWDGTHHEVWKSDGTTGGTALVEIVTSPTDPYTTPQVGWAGAFGGRLIFLLRGDLWTTDGTPSGTFLLRSFSAAPRDFVPAGGYLFFTASDDVHGNELGRTDGSEAGTLMLRDINPDGSALGQGYLGRSYLTNVGGYLYFVPDDGVHGLELWGSDGTPDGTVLVADIMPGAGSSMPESLVASGGRLFFVANDGVAGRELWVTSPRRTTTNDATGEGLADVLLHEAVGGIGVLRSTDAAVFTRESWKDGGLPSSLYDVYFADVTGDGKADVISRQRQTGDVEVYRSTGDGFLRADGSGPNGVWTWGFSAGSYDLYFADVTGDGKADLITRVKSGGGWPIGDVWVFPSTGSTFASPQAPWSYGWSDGYDLFFGDVNGDGKADLVGRYFGPTAGLTGDIYVALSTGSGFAFSGRWTYGFSAGYDIYVGDMDGDGKADLMARYYGVGATPTGDVYVIYSDGTQFTWRGNYDRWTYGWGSTYELMVRDVSGDGKADLIGRSSATGDVVVATSTGSGLVFQGTWATGVDTSVRIR